MPYRYSDNSGRASVVIIVVEKTKKGLKLRKRTVIGLRKLFPRTYVFRWKPKKSGKYLFCVRAFDAAGNESKLRLTWPHPSSPRAHVSP